MPIHEASAYLLSIGPFGLHDSFHEGPRPSQHTPAPKLLARTRCVWQTSNRGVLELKNTAGTVLACIERRGGGHVSPQVLANLGSTIASMIALAHAHVPLLVLFPYEVRAAKERRWCTPPAVYLSLNTPPEKTGIHGLRTRQVRISWSTGPFGLYDSFHESPRPFFLLFSFFVSL